MHDPTWFVNIEPSFEGTNSDLNHTQNPSWDVIENVYTFSFDALGPYVTLILNGSSFVIKYGPSQMPLVSPAPALYSPAYTLAVHSFPLVIVPLG